MEAQLHPGPEGGQGKHHHQGHGEKTSVLKKVKEKAKKIKDTIKKHGHHQENEEEDEDPQVHGAPIYESTVVRSVNLPRGRDGGNLENPRNKTEEDLHSPNNSPAKILRSNNGGEEEQLSPSDNLNDQFVDPGDCKVGSAVNGGGDKRLPSVKEYVFEKLRPGEEDKKLSEAISDAFQKKKEAVWGKEEAGGKGRVRVSKEVAERLGTVPESKREGEDAVAAGEESSGRGVAERLQNAVGAWLGKSTGIQTAQDSIGNAFVNHNKGSGSAGTMPSR